MNDLYWLLDEYMVTIIFTLCVVCGLLLFLFLLLFILYAKQRKRFKHFLQQPSDKDLTVGQLLSKYVDESRKVAKDNINIFSRLEIIENQSQYNFQKMTIMRYNPFEDMGGNQSFAIALLDGQNNGLILNGVHTRETTHTYAKPVLSGKSQYKLSEEEQQVLNEALTK